MTRLQETEHAYLVAKLGYLNVLILEIASGRVGDEHGSEWVHEQYNACEKRLLTLEEEIAR